MHCFVLTNLVPITPTPTSPIIARIFSLDKLTISMLTGNEKLRKRILQTFLNKLLFHITSPPPAVSLGFVVVLVLPNPRRMRLTFSGHTNIQYSSK